MKINFDWKFQATLAIGILSVIASIAVPFAAWKVDLEARSIAVRGLSSVSLQPSAAPVADVQVTLDGKNIDRAYVTTIEVVNDGSKPILASDFESDLLVSVGQDVTIIRSQVAERKPINLPVVLKDAGNTLRMQPLLLNPGDSAKIVLITSGGKLALSPSGRIAGVSNIRFEEAQEPDPKLFIRVAIGISIVAGFVGYVTSFMSFMLTHWRTPRVRLITVFGTSISVGLAVNAFVWDFAPPIRIVSNLKVGFLLIGCAVLGVIAIWVLSKLRVEGDRQYPYKR